MAVGNAAAAGAAHDATIVVENNVAALEDALAAARARDKAQFFTDQVARMKAKVAKEEAALESARASLAAAEAELAAHGGAD